MSETLPNGGAPIAVAVNSASHHIYAVSFGGSSSARVYNFDEDGELDPVHPELTGDSLLGALRVAVDNSGGAHAGYIYVVKRAESGNPVFSVQQFDPAGQATAVTITESAVPANGTAQAGGLPPVVNNGAFEPRSVSVDSSGNVFVTDTAARAIDVFTPTGVFVRQIASAVSLKFPEGIAIDGPDLYVALGGRDGPAESVGPGLIELDTATGECVAVGCAPIETNPAPINGVAVDGAAGTIFTAGLVNPADGAGGGKVTEYDAATGGLLGVTKPKALHLPVGIAVDESSHKVIVADFLPANEATVKVFGPVETVPDVKTLTPEEVTDHSVKLKGEIGAAGLTGVTCVFQYVDQEEFAAHGFEGTPGHPAPTAPCEPAGPFSGEAMNPVEAEITGLRGGTTYHERILGESTPGQTGKGANAGEDIPFPTKGPTVAGTEAVAVTETTATLEGTVNPNGSATTYRFQYLPQVQWEAGGWAGATEAPAGGAPVGSVTKAEPVSQPIGGLVPGTTYRLRILAVSTAGTTKGEEVEFTAQQAPLGGLPDGRAYEQASPVGKNGTDVQGGVNSVQSSLEGDRITFFSNAGIPGGEGAQNFPTFMASRAPDGSGWSTRGLLPPASYGPRGAVLGWTEDLTETYDFAWAPFEEVELLRGVIGAGALTRVGTNPTAFNPFAYAGSSQGGAVALLESQAGGMKGTVGPADLEGKQNLYAYDRGSGQLVVAGVLNDSTVPPGGAMAGPYDWFKSGSTNIGGALASFYTQSTQAISADGREVFFTAGGTGQLYVRVNPFGTPQELTPTECRAPTNEAACTIRVSAPGPGVATDPKTPAAFLGASADGRLVYFLDKGKLTTDATGGTGFDLYRYDVTSGTLTDLSLDTTDKAGARVEGMLGIGGPEGEYAYFVAAGQLAGGATQAPVGETNLYALHDTTIDFVARLGNSEAVNGEPLAWTPTSAQGGGIPSAHASRVSADGQTLLFRSARRLTAYKNHGVAELYLLRTGAPISCISCNPSGEAPNGPAGVQEIPQTFLSVTRTAIMTRNLSADGRRVFFDSPDRLVAGDRNDVNDVYEWEAKGEGSCTSEAEDGGCLFLISGGAPDGGPSWFGDADEEGNNVFFFTAQPLVAQDGDELVDVYDARVGGGIAAQNKLPPPPPCEGEAGCRAAAPPPPPSPPSPGSTGTFPGNPPACKKGQVRKHGKCVKKPKKNQGKKSNDKKSKNKKKKGGKGRKGGRG
ncbi:MAG TPA: hypothetical protein VJL81_01015 [Solirubrobacterales bacterium]|nr:hypothetical protein [Solirubrobacterales bacterium]